jgi:hypothetical protein
MCTAIGTAVGSVLQDMQGFQLIINFMVLPLFFFSSALFPVPDLPGAMRVAVRLNPLSYGVDGLRGALSGGFVFGAAIDFAVLGLLAAILLAIGAWLFSKIEVLRRYVLHGELLSSLPPGRRTSATAKGDRRLPERQELPISVVAHLGPGFQKRGDQPYARRKKMEAERRAATVPTRDPFGPAQRCSTWESFVVAAFFRLRDQITIDPTGAAIVRPPVVVVA